MAMADPEIQRILMDPAVNQVLKEMSENPQAAQKALDDPVRYCSNPLERITTTYPVSSCLVISRRCLLRVSL